MPHPEFRWRAEINAIEFRPCGHRGACVVHKLAIRTIVDSAPTHKTVWHFRGPTPTPWFAPHRPRSPMGTYPSTRASI